MKHLIKFRGDKWAVGRRVANRSVGQLRNGAAVDMNGIVFGHYERLVCDGGDRGDYQEIEFTIED